MPHDGGREEAAAGSDAVVRWTEGAMPVAARYRDLALVEVRIGAAEHRAGTSARALLLRELRYARARALR